MTNITVYSEEGVYAGWPANHGAWQWGNEFLCGFMRGPHEITGAHNIGHPYEKVQARSLDGGETWTVEIPNIQFTAKETFYDEPDMKWLDRSKDIIRVCGVYDTGGEDCDPFGGFYTSSNKGKDWNGAWKFSGLEDIYCDKQICTSRTAVLDNFVFLTAADSRYWGSDATFCCEFKDGNFNLLSTVCNDSYRAVMPAVTRIDEKVFCALRRRYSNNCWIDLFESRDSCKTWQYTSMVGFTGCHNGNPPALISIGDKLVCTFGNRTTQTINAMISSDLGKTWKQRVLREGKESDIGYPRLFKRDDNKLVCVYYWSDSGEAQRIEATIFEV